MGYELLSRPERPLTGCSESLQDRQSSRAAGVTEAALLEGLPPEYVATTVKGIPLWQLPLFTGAMAYRCSSSAKKQPITCNNLVSDSYTRYIQHGRASLFALD